MEGGVESVGWHLQCRRAVKKPDFPAALLEGLVFCMRKGVA